MSLTKFQLDFDPAETDCDQVKSYVSSSDGTLITHTTLGGIEALDVNIANTGAITVDGEVSLDAATLAALETVTVEQGTSPWVVSATDLDIRDLSASQDNVAISDGTDTLAIESDGSINVNSSEAGFSGCNNAAVNVGTTATDLLATDLANRKSILIQNLGSKPIYIGCDNSVTTSNGIKVPKGGSAEFRMGPGIDVHAITPAGNADVRVIEFS